MYGSSNGGNDEDGNSVNTNNEEGWGDGEDGNSVNINNEGGHDEDGNSLKIDGNKVGNDGINAKIKGSRTWREGQQRKHEEKIGGHTR